jgi:hypothetical protein
MKNIVFIIIFLIVCKSNAQFSYSTRYLLGTFHEHDVTINGIALGAFPNINVDKPYVKTNGFRFEALGLGFFAPIGNGSRVSGVEEYDKKKYTDYSFGEVVNGINISTTGTIGDVCFNGITMGGIAQFGVVNNGIALAGLWNAMDKSNGVQVSFLLNETLCNNGIQVALTNTSLFMNGVQIGAISSSSQKIHGIQISAQNLSESGFGIQIGIHNQGGKTKGIQLGLWNKNEKRSLPFFNWNFK